MIKKIIIAIAIASAALLAPALAAQPAFAVDVINQSGSACNNANAASKPSFCKDNQTGGTNPIYGQGGILTAIINLLAKIVGVVSVIIIVISGIRMIMSQDANASANARRGIISAVVGLVIALMAQALVSFVLNKIVAK